MSDNAFIRAAATVYYGLLAACEQTVGFSLPSHLLEGLEHGVLLSHALLHVEDALLGALGVEARVQLHVQLAYSEQEAGAK